MLLSATTIKAHYEMPEHIEISLLEHDLRICSKLDQNPSFFKSDKNPDYWLAIYTGSNLNLECLQEKLQNKLINYPKMFVQNGKINISHDLSYYKSYITNFERTVCVEECYLDEDTIIFDGNKYWYIYDLYNGYGHRANFTKTIENKIHIELFESTHTKNFLFDTKNSEFLHLYDGRLQFYNQYYISAYSKAYFDGGGAYWYSAKWDYDNNLLELLDIKSDFTSCEEIKHFKGNTKIYQYMMIKNNLKKCAEN